MFVYSCYLRSNILFTRYLRSNSKQTKLDYYVDDTDTGSDHYLTFHCDRPFSTNIVSELLEQLEMGKIIRLIPGKEKGKITSYELTRPSVNISLLDILEATGEHLNCNHPATEDFYLRYGNTAKKLGVVNHMTRLYLEEIKLNDL